MYRQSFDTSSGPVNFPGTLVQLTRPKQVFIEHVVHPNQASLHRGMLPKILYVLNSFITFTRYSIATRVNETGLIETVPADHARIDYDPITLQQKGLLIEEERTNVMTFSNNFSVWNRIGTTVTPSSTDFPIFANGNVWLFQANGSSGVKFISRTFIASSTIRTASAPT